jgi:hypothetical protein
MAAKIDLEADNVFVKNLTLEEARTFDEAVVEEIETVVDEAQGHVFMGKSDTAFVIIQITK